MKTELRTGEVYFLCLLMILVWILDYPSHIVKLDFSRTRVEIYDGRRTSSPTHQPTFDRAEVSFVCVHLFYVGEMKIKWNKDCFYCWAEVVGSAVQLVAACTVRTADAGWREVLSVCMCEFPTLIYPHSYSASTSTRISFYHSLALTHRHHHPLSSRTSRSSLNCFSSVRPYRMPLLHTYSSYRIIRLDRKSGVQ